MEMPFFLFYNEVPLQGSFALMCLNTYAYLGSPQLQVYDFEVPSQLVHRLHSRTLFGACPAPQALGFNGS